MHSYPPDVRGSDPPPAPPGPEMRPQPGRGLFLVLLVLLGTCGIGQGLGQMEDRPAPGSLESSADASSMVSREFAEILWQDPNRRPLGAANALVSGLILVGAFMFVARRKNAVWWVQQAFVANGVWSIATALSSFAQIKRSRGALRKLAEEGPWSSSEDALNLQRELGSSNLVDHIQTLALGFIVLQALLRVTLFVMLFYYARRFRSQAPPSPSP